MKSSESVSKIAASLLAAQKALKVALKDARNPHFNSRFADLTSIIEVAQPALNDAGIVFLQPVSFNEGRVVVETVLMHESGEWVADSLEIPLTTKQDAQAVGSAVSYGRRYGLQSFIGIKADDDDGNKASEGEPVKQVKYITSAQAKEFRDACSKKGVSPETVKKALQAMSIPSTAQIPVNELPGFYTWLEEQETAS